MVGLIRNLGPCGWRRTLSLQVLHIWRTRMAIGFYFLLVITRIAHTPFADSWRNMKLLSFVFLHIQLMSWNLALLAFFGPLLWCWKSNINNTACGHVPITTTMQSAQPLPAIIPDLVSIELILLTSDDNNSNCIPTTIPDSSPTICTCFWLAILSPLHQTASQQHLQLQILALFDLLHCADQQIQVDYAQMQLMDNENGCLCQQAYAKAKKRGKDQHESSEACHMTLTKSLEKLACSDWKAEMQAPFKLIREHGKTQGKDIANHNKKALKQEKWECTLDKWHAAENKAEAEAERQLVQWCCEMAGLGKFVMEEMEKSKKKKPPEKAKATRAAKSMCLQERSECNQQLKERETPKKKGSHWNHAKSDKWPSANSNSLDQ